jgi:hypothetical protein
MNSFETAGTQQPVRTKTYAFQNDKPFFCLPQAGPW